MCSPHIGSQVWQQVETVIRKEESTEQVVVGSKTNKVCVSVMTGFTSISTQTVVEERLNEVEDRLGKPEGSSADAAI